MKNIKISFSVPTFADAKEVAERLATKAAQKIVVSDEEKLAKLQTRIKEAKLAEAQAAEIEAIKSKYSKQMNA